MKYSFDGDAFEKAIRQHRGDLSLRSYLDQVSAGGVHAISASTASRLEDGSSLDMDAICLICSAMGIHPGCFFTHTPEDKGLEEIKKEITSLAERMNRIESKHALYEQKD